MTNGAHLLAVLDLFWARGNSLRPAQCKRGNRTGAPSPGKPGGCQGTRTPAPPSLGSLHPHQGGLPRTTVTGRKMRTPLKSSSMFLLHVAQRPGGSPSSGRAQEKRGVRPRVCVPRARVCVPRACVPVCVCVWAGGSARSSGTSAAPLTSREPSPWAPHAALLEPPIPSALRCESPSGPFGGAPASRC